MRVRALQNIWHNAAAHPTGSLVDLPDELAEQLRQAGLVEIVEESKPQLVERPKPEAVEPVEPPPAKCAAVSRRKKK